MTHLASVGAPQAALVAGREEHAGGAADASSMHARPDARLQALAAASLVAPGVAALLARLLARLPTGGEWPASVQFLPCCPAERAAGIANSIACAASLLVGRTLLLDAHPHGRMPGDADLHSGLLPDAFLPGLYHRRIGGVRSRGSAFFAPDILAAHTAEARQFRFIAVDSPAPAVTGAALALAPLCAGSVLVVLAGVTRLAAIQAAAADVTAAGGHLLGTVMADPQMNFPRTISA